MYLAASRQQAPLTKLLFVFFFVGQTGFCLAQNFFVLTSPPGSIGILNVTNGTYTPLWDGPYQFYDITFGIDGTLYGLGDAGIFEVNQVTGGTTLVIPIPGNDGLAMCTGPDGLLYVAGSGLRVVNPFAGTVSGQGLFPANYFAEGDLAFVNGQLVCTANNGSTCMLAVDIDDAGNSYCFAPLPYEQLYGLATLSTPTCGTLLFAAGINDNDGFGQVFSINTATFDITLVGNYPGITFAGAVAPPWGTNGNWCQCISKAGSFAQNPLHLCPDERAYPVFNQDTVLAPNDQLHFVLCSDTTNVAGSLLIVSDTLGFPFLNGMLFNKTYYIASVVSDTLLGGGVDWADPCISISQRLPVVWHRNPSLLITAAPPDICSGSNCVDLSFYFTGKPLFSFTWEATQNGVAVSNGQISNHSTYWLTTSLCMDGVNAAEGPLKIRVTSVSDKYCTCQE